MENILCMCQTSLAPLPVISDHSLSGILGTTRVLNVGIKHLGMQRETALNHSSLSLTPSTR